MPLEISEMVIAATVDEESRAAAPADERLLATETSCSILVDNEKIEYDIARVELRQYIDKHHHLQLTIRERAEDTQRDISTYASYLGKPISLTIKPAGGVIDESRTATFVGVITRVDQNNNIDSINVTTIEAHSPTIAMDGAKKNAFYRDQSSTDIAGAILRNYPITLGKIDSSGDNHTFSVQHRETDYDYVMRLAAGCGLFAHYDGQEFHVNKPGSSDAEELVWRESLGLFSLGLGTAPQEFTAQVYNYEQSKSYEQDTKAVQARASLSALSKAAPDGSEKIYKTSGFSTAPKIVSDARSLDDVLLREKSRAMGRMVICQGQSSVPAVKVGRCVSIKGLEQLDGHYLVSSVCHVVNATGSYRNGFVCHPLDIAFPAAHSAVAGETQLQSAVVVDNKDPDGLGRIKVKFPWLESEETIWVRFLTPHAGADRGWFALPEIDDEVLVGYAFDNPHHPIALGALYNKNASPPSSTQSAENDVKLFCTRGGNQIMINDKSGSEEITITTKDNSNSIVLNMPGPKITIQSDGDILLKGNNIRLESEQELTLKAGSNMKVEASGNMETKASGTFNAEGATVTVKGNPINLN